MTDKDLNRMKVAILVTDGFEQVELTEPRKALDDAGAETRIVSPKDREVRGWEFTDWGRTLPVDIQLNQRTAGGFRRLAAAGRGDKSG